jgi:hypothetical protein
MGDIIGTNKDDNAETYDLMGELTLTYRLEDTSQANRHGGALIS